MIFPIPKEGVKEGFDKIHVDDINCDLVFPHLSKDTYIESKFTSLSPGDMKSEVNGYLCSKEVWISTCYENFLTHQSKTFKIKPSKIQRTECEDAIINYQKGEIEYPVKPNYQCSWLTENSNMKTYLLVKDHKVKLDHYSMALISPLLYSGHCYGVSCNTKYDNMLWIRGSRSKLTCPELVNKTTLLYFKGSNPSRSEVFIGGDYIPLENLEGTCKGLAYCGHEFYVTRYGHGFSTNNLPPNPKYLHLFANMPNCGKREVIKMDKRYEFAEVENKMIDSIRLERCLDTVEKIRNNQKISRRDLGFLNPIIPGTGDGFIIFDGKVRKSEIRYIGVSNLTINCDKIMNICTIKALSKTDGLIQKNFRCRSVMEGTRDWTCNWYNGIILYQDRLIYPEAAIMDRELTDLMIMRHPVSYDQHIFLNNSDEISLSTSEDIPNTKNGNLLEYIESSISDSETLHVLYWIVGSVLFIIILSFLYRPLMLVFKIYRKCCCLPKLTKRSNAGGEEVELKEIQTHKNKTTKF